MLSLKYTTSYRVIKINYGTTRNVWKFITSVGLSSLTNTVRHNIIEIANTLSNPLSGVTKIELRLFFANRVITFSQRALKTLEYI